MYIKENFLPLQEKENLIGQALLYKGLDLEQGYPNYCSNLIGTYKLEGEFLKALKENGFKLTEKDGIVSLSDLKNCDYWNFRKRGDEKDKLLLNLKIGSTINQLKRGVILKPRVFGTFLSSTNILSQQQVFQVVAQVDSEAHPLIYEINASKGEIVVMWADINLGGIRNLRNLFEEFMHKNDKLKDLARSDISPFDPNPYHKEKILYLSEPYQPVLFQIWREQLNEFKSKI